LRSFVLYDIVNLDRNEILYKKRGKKKKERKCRSVNILHEMNKKKKKREEMKSNTNTNEEKRKMK